MTDKNVNEIIENIEQEISSIGHVVQKSNGGKPTVVETDHIVARLTRAAQICRDLGRYANEHGAYVNEISTTFAEHLEKLMNEYSSKIMEAEEAKMAEFEKLIGK